MAQNKTFNFGPVALANGAYTTNILNVGAGARGTPPVGYTDTQAYIILRHLRVVNTTGGALTFRLFKGATGANAAGTEVVGRDLTVPAASYIDWYGQMRFDSADFLVGGGSGAGLVLQGEGEIGVSG